MNLLFVLSLALLLVLLFSWALKRLPNEGWQFLLIIPSRRIGPSQWEGINLTYYGLFNANAYALGTALTLILMGTTGISFISSISILTLLLAICIPASKIVAYIVEGRKNTLTVGGASFVGMMITPWILLALNAWSDKWPGLAFPLWPTLAALTTGYVVGEGVGRLACVSFGCCYGKPLARFPAWVQSLFGPFAFRFTEPTRKAVYADAYKGIPLFPVQGLTAILYSGTGLVAFWLCLEQFFISAFLLGLIVTQVWRVLSEFMRDDYRGNNTTLSAYQWMSLSILPYAVLLVLILPATSDALPSTNLMHGLSIFRAPITLLFFAALWTTTLLFTGLSAVTTSTVHFTLAKDK